MLAMQQLSCILASAGVDTSAMAMTNALAWMWRKPEWLRRLQQEQDRLVADLGSDLSREVRGEAVL